MVPSLAWVVLRRAASTFLSSECRMTVTLTVVGAREVVNKGPSHGLCVSWTWMDALVPSSWLPWLCQPCAVVQRLWFKGYDMDLKPLYWNAWHL